MLIAMAVYDTVENNRTWMTKATLDSLRATVDWDRHRLFVVDNGSCEATRDLYKTCTDWPVSFILLGQNYGTAQAVNRGWQHRRPGEHAVKMDNDVVIHQPGWCDWMEDVFERDPEIGIVGLKRKDLAESPFAEGGMRSSIRMLAHDLGQRWLVVEDVDHVIGTCEGFSSALLDKIGYLTQPALYGFDDSLAGVRANVAGFKSVFLHGFEIDHVDPGGDAYCEWKREEAARLFPTFNTTTALIQAGVESVYYDGGFDE